MTTPWVPEPHLRAALARNEAFWKGELEEILAIKRAMDRIGLGRSDVEAFFVNNARRVLGL